MREMEADAMTGMHLFEGPASPGTWGVVARTSRGLFQFLTSSPRGHHSGYGVKKTRAVTITLEGAGVEDSRFR